MATKKFTEFSTATPLTTSDYIVGYNAAGTAELKTQVNDILNLKSDSDAQNLTFNEVNKNLTISSGNTVSLSSLSDSSIVNSVSGLLTPLTTTNTLTGLLTPLTTTNTLTGLLLLTSIYQNASGNYVQNTSGNYVLQGGNSTTTPLSVGTSTTQPLILETNNFNRVIILSSGNVGIGTIEPNNTLTVNGIISSTSTLYASGGIVDSLYAGPMAGNLSLNTPISAVNGVYINPVNGYTGIQTLSSIAPLDVRGTMVYAASAITGTTPSNIRVRDNYAYITNYGNNSFWIYDLSQTTLSFVASASTSTQPQGLYINGRYAYVVTSNSSSSVLQIFDISQTATPILLSTTTIGAGANQNAFEVVVQGNYAFVLTNVTNPGTNCYIIAYDISNPYAPNKVLSLQPTNNFIAHSLTVQGKYIYWGSSGAGTVRIYRIDTTDLRRTPTIETVYSTSGSFTGGIVVRGKYLYITINNILYIIDIITGTIVGNTGTLASSVGQSFLNNIVLQDNYAYVGTIIAFIKVDITDPFSPRAVQSIPINIGATSFPSNFAIQGRYAYLPDRNTGRNRVVTVDLGGAYVQQLEAGGIKTDSLDVVGNTVLGSDLDVKGGAAFGQGFKSYKDSNIQGSLHVTSLTSMSASTYFSVASSSGSTLFAITSTGKIQINTPSTLEFNTQAVQPGVTLTTSTSCLLITVNGTELKIPLLS